MQLGCAVLWLYIFFCRAKIQHKLLRSKLVVIVLMTNIPLPTFSSGYSQHKWGIWAFVVPVVIAAGTSNIAMQFKKIYFGSEREEITTLKIIANCMLPKMKTGLLQTRTTWTSVFWRYPPLPHDYPYHWVILDPKSKEDKVKVTNLKNLPKFQFFFNFETTFHATHLLIQSEKDSDHRWTDGRVETSIPTYNFAGVIISGNLIICENSNCFVDTSLTWTNVYISYLNDNMAQEAGVSGMDK